MKPELERLELFAKTNFKSVRQMSIAAGLEPSYFSSYLTKDSIPGNKVRPVLKELGLNIIWLDTGEGEMYADNENGKKLKMLKDLKEGKPTSNVSEVVFSPLIKISDLKQMTLEQIIEYRKNLKEADKEVENYLKEVMEM